MDVLIRKDPATSDFLLQATVHRADKIISHGISTETLDGIPIELVIYAIFLFFDESIEYANWIFVQIREKFYGKNLCRPDELWPQTQEQDIIKL